MADSTKCNETTGNGKNESGNRKEPVQGPASQAAVGVTNHARGHIVGSMVSLLPGTSGHDEENKTDDAIEGSETDQDNFGRTLTGTMRLVVGHVHDNVALAEHGVSG